MSGYLSDTYTISPNPVYLAPTIGVPTNGNFQIQYTSVNFPYYEIINNNNNYWGNPTIGLLNTSISNSTNKVNLATDSSNATIYGVKVTPTPLSSSTYPYNNNNGISVDLSGNVYILGTNSGFNKILVMDNSFGFLKYITPNLTMNALTQIVNYNNILYTDNLYSIPDASNCTNLTTIPSILANGGTSYNTNNGIAINNNYIFYNSTTISGGNHYIYSFLMGSNIITQTYTYSDASYGQLNSLVFDSSNNLYSISSSKIYKFTTDGSGSINGNGVLILTTISGISSNCLTYNPKNNCLYFIFYNDDGMTSGGGRLSQLFSISLTNFNIQLINSTTLNSFDESAIYYDINTDCIYLSTSSVNRYLCKIYLNKPVTLTFNIPYNSNKMNIPGPTSVNNYNNNFQLYSNSGLVIQSISGIGWVFPNGQIFNLNTYPCFLENTKILTDNGYKLIQHIRPGDLIQTLFDGLVPVDMIGYSVINNPGHSERIQKRLYICSTQEYPEIFEDLYITGAHSILVSDFKEGEREKTEEALGQIYITNNRYRLPACVDERAKPYECEGDFTIYHLALKHPDYYMNYGIYANGLLVESTSQRYLKEVSGMTLLGEPTTHHDSNLLIENIN